MAKKRKLQSESSELCDQVGRRNAQSQRYRRRVDLPRSACCGRCYDRLAMSEEHDRVVTESLLKSTLTSALNDFEKRLEKRISEEGAATRTHFNVMVERVESAVKLVAEVNSHHSTVLDDHESRLQKIEKRA